MYCIDKQLNDKIRSTLARLIISLSQIGNNKKILKLWRTRFRNKGSSMGLTT
jgi:hypothetical protein